MISTSPSDFCFRLLFFFSTILSRLACHSEPMSEYVNSRTKLQAVSFCSKPVGGRLLSSREDSLTAFVFARLILRNRKRLLVVYWRPKRGEAIPASITYRHQMPNRQKESHVSFNKTLPVFATPLNNNSTIGRKATLPNFYLTNAHSLTSKAG